MPHRRPSSFVWVTWIAKLMAGEAHCLWSAWFRAHYAYDKDERRGATAFARWQIRHAAMVDDLSAQMRGEGYAIYVEDQNLFRIGRDGIVLSGKPDIVVLKDSEAIVLNCKTGCRRASHQIQVKIYMIALPWCHPLCRAAVLEGRLQYPDGTVHIPSEEIDGELRTRLRLLVRAVGGDSPPSRVPSVSECGLCDIPTSDCPDRIDLEVVPVEGEHDLF